MSDKNRCGPKNVGVYVQGSQLGSELRKKYDGPSCLVSVSYHIEENHVDFDYHRKLGSGVPVCHLKQQIQIFITCQDDT
jgi:hypothetical protein